MDVKAKVAVVTGGAQGIGLALRRRFAQEGAHVVLSDLNSRGGRERVTGDAPRRGRAGRQRSPGGEEGRARS
jgi:NAD(P)-dependent dehydrogenase (short-subunit alcohol dehydrogenase family)